jgi:hypothetical protein
MNDDEEEAFFLHVLTLIQTEFVSAQGMALSIGALI